MKVGDKITLDIVGVGEDSYEVSYTSKGKSEESGPGEGMPEAQEDEMMQ